mgnify:CR=1|tara:strand:+ start:2818 stop:2958 length:141 start_codon:yes stop_codon:yes gene_type:complete
MGKLPFGREFDDIAGLVSTRASEIKERHELKIKNDHDRRPDLGVGL